MNRGNLRTTRGVDKRQVIVWLWYDRMGRRGKIEESTLIEAPDNGVVIKRCELTVLFGPHAF